MSFLELPSLVSFNCGSWALCGPIDGPDGPLQATFDGNIVKIV